MVRFTLLEVNLDGAEFDATAPVSDRAAKEAKADVEATLEEQLERGTGGADSGTSPVALLAALFALAGAVAAARKLLSRRSRNAETETEAPIVAD